jgi:ribosomal protein S7
MIDKNKIEIAKKLIRHLMLNGEKNTSEKLFLKSLKALQVKSLKQTKKVLQLCLINLTPLFKLHKSSNKKVKKKKRKIKITPVFINKTQNRTSFGIKFFLQHLRKIKSNAFFYQKLTNEILLVADKKGIIPELKKESQKNVNINKRYLKHYRW